MTHRVIVLDDIKEVADLLAAPLEVAGYEVMTALTSVNFERVMNFKPELVVLGLHRRLQAFNRPIQNIERDVLGFRPLVDMEHYPAVSVIPVILVSTGLKEADIPTSLNYDSFIVLPEDAELYLPKVQALIEKVKSRRKISQYVCPNCGSRLTYTGHPIKDLFCPRCHTGVLMVDNSNVVVIDPLSHESQTCPISSILLHEGDTSDQAEARALKRHPPK